MTESKTRVWLCSICGCVGRAAHDQIGRCLTPDEITAQKARIARVEQMVKTIAARNGIRL